MSWETFYTYDSEGGGAGDVEEMQVRRTDDGVQFRIVAKIADDDAEGEVLWSSDEDLGAGDLIEALEEAIAERDLSGDLMEEIAEGLEPHLTAAERRTLKVRLDG